MYVCKATSVHEPLFHLVAYIMIYVYYHPLDLNCLSSCLTNPQPAVRHSSPTKSNITTSPALSNNKSFNRIRAVPSLTSYTQESRRMAAPHHVLLIGGHGKVAQLLTPLLLKRSWAVTSMIRTQEQAPAIEKLGKDLPGKLNVLVNSVGDVSTQEQAATILKDVKPDYIAWSAGTSPPPPPEKKRGNKTQQARLSRERSRRP